MTAQTAHTAERLPLLPKTQAAMNRYLNAVSLSDGSADDREHTDRMRAEYSAARDVDPACMIDEAAELERIADGSRPAIAARLLQKASGLRAEASRQAVAAKAALFLNGVAA